jgi:plasmid stabilization system protein ParE
MAESPRRVDFTRRAAREYLEGLLHIAAENVFAAVLVQERIEAALALLQRHARIGRLGMVRGTREFPVTRTSYTIVYRVRRATIEVLRVLHQRRRYP